MTDGWSVFGAVVLGGGAGAAYAYTRNQAYGTTQYWAGWVLTGSLFGAMIAAAVG
jgi:hypothetical protein